MKTINDGGPAFPDDHSQVGMSLRAYLAGQALAGILSSGDVEIKTIAGDKWAAASLTQSCYIIADAMLKAQEEKL